MGAPAKSSVGILKCGLCPSVISLMDWVVASASRIEPSPTNPTTAGEAAMALPPRPRVSRIALSPMSGLASAGVKPGKYIPATTGAGAVNHRAPRPLTLIPNSTPFRLIAVTTVLCGISRIDSSAHFAAAIAMLRKN